MFEANDPLPFPPGLDADSECQFPDLPRMFINASKKRSGKDMVVFGEDWGAHPSSTQHLMKHLAADWTILWVNSLGLRRPRFTLKDSKRLLAKLNARYGAAAGPTSDGPKAPFKVVPPLVLPFPASKAARFVNATMLRRTLRPLLQAGNMRRPILWASLPTAVFAARQLGERALVYYCGDDFSALEGVDHGPVSRLEHELAFRADLVIAASEPLASRFPKEKTIVVTHGVDFELFSKPVERAPDLPKGKPVAGYYGSIASWVDLEAVALAARKLPEWDFVFIGKIETDIAPVTKLPNVRFLGPRPHSNLPSYAQHWTVSLIPFRSTAQIHACNPLKLREYLAAGRPIASSIAFPALEAYRRHISVAPAPVDLALAILDASQRGEDACLRRSAVAHESWAAKASEIKRALEAL
jgi:glycosyltransferase involved in cell wall biosynthesis